MRSEACARFEPETRNKKPATFNSQPSTRNPQPETVRPADEKNGARTFLSACGEKTNGRVDRSRRRRSMASPFSGCFSWGCEVGGGIEIEIGIGIEIENLHNDPIPGRHEGQKEELATRNAWVGSHRSFFTETRNRDHMLLISIPISTTRNLQPATFNQKRETINNLQPATFNLEGGDLA